MIEPCALIFGTGPENNGIRDGENFDTIWVKQSPNDIATAKSFADARGASQGHMKGCLLFGGRPVFEENGEGFFVGFTDHDFVRGILGVMGFNPVSSVGILRNRGRKHKVIIVADALPCSRPDGK